MLQCAYHVSTPFPWFTFTKFPYEPLYLAKVTVPEAVTLIGVPELQAISKPVWLELLILLLTPYLEDIVPVTGLTANFIPLTSPFFVLLTIPFDSFLLEFALFLFNVILLFMSVLATSTEVVFISSAFSVHFCAIVSSKSLFSSFNELTSSSASSKVSTELITSLFNAIS